MLFGRRYQPRQVAAAGAGAAYLGVCPSSKQWTATLTSRSSDAHIALGVFDSATEAATAFDQVCVARKFTPTQVHTDTHMLTQAHTGTHARTHKIGWL